MKLTVIGSRSDGNAYVLQNAGVALLLEAGLPFKKTLAALDYRLDKVVGCLVSHEHKDHAEFVSEYLDNGIPVFASSGTTQGMNERWVTSRKPPIVIDKDAAGRYNPISLGNFTIVAFRTIHSTQEPTGFYIHHPEMGCVLFATDTGYLPDRFAGLTHVMIEANYDRDILDRRYWDGAITKRRYDHVRRGHMCIDTTIEALRANDISRVNNIVLLHLSEEHADPERFKRMVVEATGKATEIACPSLEIEFNEKPF